MWCRDRSSECGPSQNSPPKRYLRRLRSRLSPRRLPIVGAPQLVDAFLFAEPYEAEVLLAKLHVESELISAWVVVENTYTPKGEWKGNHLQAVLDGDRRFDPYRDRLHVISLDENFRAAFKRSLKRRLNLAGRRVIPSYDFTAYKQHYDESPNWFAERHQRDAALPLLREIVGDDAWVFATDCDELIDGSRSTRRDTIMRALRGGAPVATFRRQRFNYDYDNYCAAMRTVSAASVRHLVSTGQAIDDVRKRLFGVVAGPEPTVYEYSYCYERRFIERKLATFPHELSTGSSLDDALRCNHAVFVGEPKWIDPTCWYERVPIDRTGGPEYIVENFERLRTRNVRDDYVEARVERYPGLFPRGYVA